VGVYRLWRDSGYAIGGLLAGVLADLLGISWAIGVVGALTLLSGIIVAFRMRETLPAKRAVLASSSALSDGHISHDR
jgi:MFS family permease